MATKKADELMEHAITMSHTVYSSEGSIEYSVEKSAEQIVGALAAILVELSAIREVLEKSN